MTRNQRDSAWSGAILLFLCTSPQRLVCPDRVCQGVTEVPSSLPCNRRTDHDGAEKIFALRYLYCIRGSNCRAFFPAILTRAIAVVTVLVDALPVANDDTATVINQGTETLIRSPAPSATTRVVVGSIAVVVTSLGPNRGTQRSHCVPLFRYSAPLPRLTTSTRRFLDRPDVVPLGAIGLLSPYPFTVRFSWRMGKCSTR